jgi:hypothetical protein
MAVANVVTSNMSDFVLPNEVSLVVCTTIDFLLLDCWNQSFVVSFKFRALFLEKWWPAFIQREIRHLCRPSFHVQELLGLITSWHFSFNFFNWQFVGCFSSNKRWYSLSTIKINYFISVKIKFKINLMLIIQKFIYLWIFFNIKLPSVIFTVTIWIFLDF